MKQLFEFYCSGGCGGYFRTKLRINIDGSYIIVCPECDHEHFRVIKKGRISGDRHSVSEAKGAERICVPKSAYSKEPVVDVKDHNNDNAAPVSDTNKRWLLWGRFAGRGVDAVKKIKDKVTGGN